MYLRKNKNGRKKNLKISVGKEKNLCKTAKNSIFLI
jgi:hypothetical protein